MLTNKEALEKYPWLAFNKDEPTGNEWGECWLDCLEPGWRIAFGDSICKEINDLLVEANFVNDYEITQIKEKWSGLRWYDDGVPESIADRYYEILHKYENMSYNTCGSCGALAKYRTVGWIYPYCYDCVSKRKDWNGNPVKYTKI